MEKRKGSHTLVNQASMHLYSPKVEQSINEWFNIADTRQKDPQKIQAILDDLKGEAKHYFDSKRSFPHRIVDPYIKNPNVQSKLLQI